MWLKGLTAGQKKEKNGQGQGQTYVLLKGSKWSRSFVKQTVFGQYHK